MKTNKINLFLASLIVLTTISWITSCTHSSDISGYPDVCFDTEVLPIITNSCAIAGCHDGSGEGMALTNYTNISHSVSPGNPDASSLYKAITSTWGENKMPPDQPLSVDNRTIIRLWIEQGAREINCAPVASTKSNSKLLSN